MVAALHPPAKKLRELVRQGLIDEPQAVRLRDKGHYGGFGILHQGCHALALAISVVGPARAVSAHLVTAGHPTTVDDVYRAPSGYGLTAGEKVTCLYELSNSAYLINEEHVREPRDAGTVRIELVGSEGALALNHAIPTAVYYSRTPHWDPARDEWTTIALSAEERTLAGHDFTDSAVEGADLWMVDEWVRALDEGRDLVINASVGAATMEMILGAYASHVEGRRIDLPQQSREHPFEHWLAREGRPYPPPAPNSYGEWLPWALAQARRPRDPATA